jgi:FixJ family two-component response regulator
MTKLVAIVDDDDSMRSALQSLLKAVGLPANIRIQDTTNDVFRTLQSCPQAKTQSSCTSPKRSL